MSCVGVLPYRPIHSSTSSFVSELCRNIGHLCKISDFLDVQPFIYLFCPECLFAHGSYFCGEFFLVESEYIYLFQFFQLNAFLMSCGMTQ